MDIPEFLASLGRRGYTFSVVDGRLFVEPKERLPRADLKLITSHMQEIIALVEKKPEEKSAEQVMEEFHQKFGGDAISEDACVEMKEYVICRFDGEEPMVFSKEFVEWWTAHNKIARAKSLLSDGRSKAQVRADKKKAVWENQRNLLEEQP